MGRGHLVFLIITVKELINPSHRPERRPGGGRKGVIAVSGWSHSANKAALSAALPAEGFRLTDRPLATAFTRQLLQWAPSEASHRAFGAQGPGGSINPITGLPLF